MASRAIRLGIACLAIALLLPALPATAQVPDLPSLPPLPDLPALPDVPLPSVCPDPVGGDTPVGVSALVGFCDGSVSIALGIAVQSPDLPLPPLPDLPALPALPSL